MASRTRLLLIVVGFLLAAAAVGFLAAFIEEKTGQSWPRWPLLAVVVISAVAVLLRGNRSPRK
jgi:small-conductance mechanosensitive channel